MTDKTNNLNEEDIIESQPDMEKIVENIEDNKPMKKGTALKCLSALLCVLLVCGIFLTIMNSLLMVTDAERFDRAINKIYGKSVRTESVAIANYNDNATIEEAYLIKDDGNYLIKATGHGGFDSGSVTCWVVVEVKNSKISGIGKVVIDSNKGQSYIANISDKFLACFSTAFVSGDVYFNAKDDGFIRTGATFSANAICNAVNGAMAFVNARFGNVAEDIYTEFDYITNISTKASSHTYNAEDNSVTFKVVSKGYGKAGEFTSNITVDKNGKITKFEIVSAGSTDQMYTDKALKNVEELFMNKNLDELLAISGTELGKDVNYKDKMFVNTGATNSTYSLYNAAIFAAANYQRILDENNAGGEEEAPDAGDGEENPDGNENGGEENE